MTLSIRFALLACAAFCAAPQLAQAQEHQIELRLEAVSYSRTTSESTVDVRVPGPAAVAVYLNSVMAVEIRTLRFGRTDSRRSDQFPNSSVTTLGAAIFLPLHFGSARGRQGFFVAPGVEATRSSFSTESQQPDRDPISRVRYGADLGFKHTLRGRVSWRHALTYRTGDGLHDAFGANTGISIFFR